MDTAFVLKLLNETLVMILLLSAPALVASLVIGLLISIFQATTQIQEQTLTFVPKIVVTFLALAITGPWLISQLVVFTQRVYGLIPRVGG
jgi:flagellar biosynthetic protein FliQ